MLGSRCNRFLVLATRKVDRSELRFFSPMVSPSFPSLLSSRSHFLGDNKRLFSKVTRKQPPHKQIVSPMPSRPSRTTIIEPPIRSRPYRQFRGKKVTPVGRGVPKRIAISNSLSREEYGSYPVQAIHAAQSIDLAAVISKVFATKGVRRMMERLSVVVQLPPDPDDEKSSGRFVAVFRFGSIVYFNVSPREVSDLLLKIKKCAVDPVLSGNELKETFCVHVQPEVPENGEVVTGEYCVVQEMNMKSVDVISNVMAQSVALDSYNDTVDELLANFEIINGKITGSGDLKTVDKDMMFRAVARNNSIFIEMVSRVGIKDRIDTAWNLTQYEDIHDGMKEEFDIDRRFEHIEFKLNLIQQNAKFFLGVLAHKKSNSLEWIIIVLIMFECVLMCMEMSGTGETMFGYLGTFFS